MILLDDRVGSVDLAKYLPAATVTRMEFGDAVVVGHELSVGVELKRVGDLLRVIQDGRFVARQLPGLLRSFDRIYLVVEGAFKPGPAGEFLLKRGRDWYQPDWGRRNGWSFAEVQRWLFSVEEGAGIRVAYTRDAFHTATWLGEMDAEFSKPAAKRRALHAVYTPPLTGFAPPTLAREWANCVPGVADRMSALVAARFRSGKRLANATVAELMEVPGIGKHKAVEIVAAIEKEE